MNHFDDETSNLARLIIYCISPCEDDFSTGLFNVGKDIYCQFLLLAFSCLRFTSCRQREFVVAEHE